jgi:hypothetical protein
VGGPLEATEGRPVIADGHRSGGLRGADELHEAAVVTAPERRTDTLS